MLRAQDRTPCMITKVMIRTPPDTPNRGPSRKVAQSHRNLAVDTGLDCQLRKSVALLACYLLTL